MKIECKTKVLAKALSKLKPIMARGTALPILGTVLLEVKGEPLGLYLSATDLGISVQFILDNSEMQIAGKPEACCVAGEFCSFLEKVETERVILELEKQSLKLKYGNNSAKFPIISAEEFPEITFPSGNEAPANELLRAMGRVGFASAKSPSDANLDCIFFGDGVFATDGKQLARVELAMKVDPFAISANHVKDIQRIFSGTEEIKFARDENRAGFYSDGVKLSAQLVEKEAPKLKNILFAKSATTHYGIARFPLLKVVGRLMVVDSRGHFAFDKGILVMEVEGGKGQVREELPVEGEDKTEQVIGLSLDYLSGGLRALEGETVKVEMEGSEMPFRMKDDEMLYILMPIRISEPEEENGRYL